MRSEVGRKKEKEIFEEGKYIFCSEKKNREGIGDNLSEKENVTLMDGHTHGVMETL